MRTLSAILMVAVACSSPSQPDCSPSGGVFADDMMLPRAAPALFGSGTPGVNVSVSLLLPTMSSASTVVGSDGAWFVSFPPASNGFNPFTVKVSCGQASYTFQRVLLGDVILCIGDGNAAMTVSSAFNASAEIAGAAAYTPSIRLLALAASSASTPQASLLQPPLLPWSPASPQTVGGKNWTTFSAFCWFTATSLFHRLQGAVPIGVVAAISGPARLKTWIPPPFAPQCGAGSPTPPSAAPTSGLFNGMLAPFYPPLGATTSPGTFSGVVLWVGENDAPPTTTPLDRGFVQCAYDSIRAFFTSNTSLQGHPLVQIQQPPLPGPAWTDDAAFFRVIQSTLGAGGSSSSSSSNFGVVVTADLSDPTSPFTLQYGRDKRTVGERAALTLAALAYPPGQQHQQQQQLLYASPTATSATLLSRSNTSSALTLEVAFAFTPPTATDATLVVDPSAACPIAIPHDDPNNGWGASSCVGVRVRSGVATFPPPPTYTPQIPGGFIGAGGDLPGSGPMTVAAAQAACTANPACVGFTFGGDSPTPPGPVNIYLKSKYSFTRAPHWQTYNSSRPAVGLWYDVPPGNLTVSPDGRSLLVSVTLPALGETVDAIQLGYAPWPLMGVTSSGGLPVHPFLLPVAQQQGQGQQGLLQVPGASAAPSQRRRRLQAPPWSTLTPLQWTPLPLGVVQPRGWLAAQLAAQVSGISGYLHKFYPPVAHSPWIVNCSAVPGGCSDTNEGEDFAYWFNAAVPMAVLSGGGGGGGGSGGDGGRLWGDVAGYVDHILTSADPATGWLGPPAGDTDGNAHWARWPVLAGLLAWREATGDGRILPALHAYMQEAYRRLTQGAPLGGDWAGSRWQDFAWVIQALLDADPGDGAGQRQGLTDLLWVVYGQQTVSWEDWYTPSFFPTGDTGWNYSSHGVNAAQGLKSGAVIYRMTQGSPQAAASSAARLALLDEFHGTPVGTFFADETLSDSMPSHGTELCAVVESIFSLNAMHEALGDAAYADRAERIAYNALPGTWTSDMLSHQYLQQANAVNALHQEEHVWLADGPDATTYGLAPNYPCCTANGPQGWPRFIPRMLHLSPDGGVAVSLLGPFAANLTLPGGSGNNNNNNNITLAITVDTEYPFGDTVVITVETHGPNTTTPIPLWVRIPGWATGATMAINGAQGAATSPPTPVPNGTMAPFSIPPPPSTTHFTLSLNPQVTLDSVGVLYNGGVSVHRGALTYALALGENRTVTATHTMPNGRVVEDFELNSTVRGEGGGGGPPWNVALVYNPGDPEGPGKYFNFSRRAGGVNATQPWDHANPCLSMTAQARQVGAWGLALGSAAGPPASPACTHPGDCGPVMDVVLVPYGAMHLRMTVLPWTPT